MTRQSTNWRKALLLAPLVLYAGPSLAQEQSATSALQETPRVVKPAIPSSSPPPSAQELKINNPPDGDHARQNSNVQARQAAKAALSTPKLQQLRPTGPITVTADHAELVGGNDAVYAGNVRVRSNTLKMDGDRLEWQQHKDGQFVAHLTGDPARMLHAGNGPQDPSITAHAQTMVYDSRAQILTLDGNAQLTRGGNVVNGSAIRYDLAKQRVQAAGGQNGQVKMIIEPPPPAHGQGGSLVPAMSTSSGEPH